MSGRILRKLAAVAGFAAILGQTSTYTYLARHDVAGTSMRVFRATVDGETVSIRYPNTWRPGLKSRAPEFNLLLEGPRGVGLRFIGSTGLAAEAKKEDAVKSGKNTSPNDQLAALHAALSSRASIGLSDYTEDAVESSSALGNGLVCFYTGVRGTTPVRGFRLTAISSRRVWMVFVISPESVWRESVPVFNKMVRSINVG